MSQNKANSRRRGHGEGTITLRADGRWEARVSLPDGKRRTLYGRTRKEASDKLVAALRDVQQGLPLPSRRLQVGTYLAQWLEEVVRPSVRATTYRSYEQMVRVHIAPALGSAVLADLQPPRIQSFLNAKLAAGLSPRSVQYLHAILRQALNQAVRWDLVSRNPAERVPTPRAPRFHAPTLSPEDARLVLDAVKGDRLEALVTVALALGLRQGEALGLTWDTVDLEARTLTVRHQLQRVAGHWQFVETKSEGSRRTLPLSPRMVDALRAHRVRQLEEQLAAGSAWRGNPFGLVFTSTVGTPLDGVKVTRRFQAKLARAGLERLRFHDLRHGAASLLLAQGVHLRVVMELLGHSSIALTANTYSHVIPRLTRDAAEQMDDVLWNSR